MPQIDEMRSELMGKAEDADAVANDSYAQSAPSGRYSLRALNTLVDSLNMVLPLFGVEAYAQFEDVPTSLPVQFVKLLNMVADAADEAELDTFKVSDMTEDGALNLASGILRFLSKSKDFKSFLAQPEAKGEAKEMMSEKPSPKMAPKMNPMPNTKPEDDMDLFASRMR